MNMRWLSAGVAAVLITGGAATLAQRAITQKTRGVLPDGTEAAHADTRVAAKPVAGPPAATTRMPTLALATPPPPGEPPQIVGDEQLVTRPDPLPAAAVPSGEIKLPPDGIAGAEVPVAAPAVVAEATAVDPGAPAAPAEAVPTATIVAEAGAAASPVDPGPAATDPAVNAASADTQGTIRPEGPRRRARVGADEPAPAESTSPGEVAAKADPVQSVEEFVERNRKEAEQAIHDLSTEAEELKARLAKVETALVRWHAFSRALKVDQPGSPAEAPEGGKSNWKKPEAAQPPKADDASPDLRPLPASAEAPAAPEPKPAAAEAPTPEPKPAPAEAPTPEPKPAPAELPMPEPRPLPPPGDLPTTTPPAAEPAPAPAAEVPPGPALPPPAGSDVPPAEPAIPPATQPKPIEPPPAEIPPSLPGAPAEPRPGS